MSERVPVTECNGCGQCCSPVVLPYSKDDARMLPPWERRRVFSDREWRWLMDELEPITRREGLARAPYLNTGRTLVSIAGETATIFSNFYRCTNYDEETGRCLSYDDRPEVCAEFPWYGAGPDPSKALPNGCSFNADVGRPVAVDPPARRTP